MNILAKIVTTTAIVASTSLGFIAPAQAQDPTPFEIPEGASVSEILALLEAQCLAGGDCSGAFAQVANYLTSTGATGDAILDALSTVAEEVQSRAVSLGGGDAAVGEIAKVTSSFSAIAAAVGADPVKVIEVTSRVATNAMESAARVPGASKAKVADAIGAVVTAAAATVKVAAAASPEARKAANTAAGALATSAVTQAVAAGIDTTQELSISAAIVTAAAVSDDAAQVAAITKVAQNVATVAVTADTLKDVVAAASASPN